MNLTRKFANRIDNDNGYDNLKLAEDLEKIANKHFEQLRLQDVSGSFSSNFGELQTELNDNFSNIRMDATHTLFLKERFEVRKRNDR